MLKEKIRYNKFMEKAARITEKMTIAEVIKNFPTAIQVFLKYGLPCVGCPMSAPETIEEAAKLHQINLEKLLKDLNKAAK